MKITPMLPLLAGLAATAWAHDTWLQAVRPVARPGDTAAFEMTSAGGFQGAEAAIQPWRVRRAVGLLAGTPFHLEVGATTEKTLSLSARLPRAGVATVAVELKPRLLELAPEKIEEYFEEIHATPAQRAQWEAVPAPRRWRETYVKFAKTFVRVGEPGDDSSWAKIFGFALEIVPEDDPTRLKAGDTFTVRVYKSGVPFSGMRLGFVADGEAGQSIAIADQTGRYSAKLDRPGRWLIHGTDLRRSAESALEWESDFVTLVVDVAPAGR